MLEQPLSSWLFKQPQFAEIIWRWDLRKYLTYLGPYGHDLMKGCHLFSNMTTLVAVQIRATFSVREKHRRRVEAKNRRLLAAGKPIKKYWTKVPGGGYQGCADLPSSAVYPGRFISAVFKCWQKAG